MNIMKTVNNGENAWNVEIRDVVYFVKLCILLIWILFDWFHNAMYLLNKHNSGR